ncbi:hypothetical protein LRS73_01585 [Methylobacterium currus]|uniref:hypothetical protein n=1 Tax=Methylobacterium currus TaxID=2051553 RepID=UPI001E2B37AD|nr:hypothetical protein [Methylobacterium currus]UHC16651.1 hypothetical protein LRS73_01585 [Methylobacterium currus]
MTTMLRAALLATCVTWSGAALAIEVKLPGKAVIGPESRAVTMTFGCSTTRSRTETGALSIGFDVPDFEALEKRFDFGAFEGPTGTRKPLTEITVAQGVRLPANGAVAVDGTSFSLGASASLRGQAAELGKLKAIAGAASAGPGDLRWRQDSPRKGDVPILVSVPIPAADADRLKAALAPCLKAN